jgi:hypothetical protein
VNPDFTGEVHPAAAVAGGEGNAGRGPSHDVAPAGTCWLCGQRILDPPHIIGQYVATRARVAHRGCLKVLGELDLDLPPAA